MNASLQPRRILALAALLGSISAATLLVPVALTTVRAWHQELLQRPHPRLVSNEDWCKIIEAVRDTGDFYGVPSAPPPPPDSEEARSFVGPLPSDEQREAAENNRPAVLQASSEVLCEVGDPYIPVRPPCDAKQVWPSLGITSDWVNTRIPLKLRRELVVANDKTVAVPVPPTPRFIAASKEDIDAIFSGRGWWDDFYSKYPGTAGIMVVSRAVLSQDGSTALVYAANRCDGVCGVGALYLLQRVNAEWKIVLRDVLWMS